MNPSTRRTHPLFARGLAAALVASSLASAANLWDGGGADGNWGTKENWDNDTVPAFPVALTFGGTSQLASNNDQTGVTVNGLTFNSDAGAFTITGNSISLGGNLTNNSANLQTLSLPLALTANRTISTASGNIAITSPISGGFGLTKNGSATLIVSGTNTNTGTTVISAGTLALGANDVLTSSGPINFPTGTTGSFDLAGHSQTTGNFSVGTNTAGSAGTVTSSVNGSSLTINTGNTNGAPFSQTLFSNGAGTLALTLLGSNPGGNVQILNPSNSFSGGLTIKSSNAGSLTAANLAPAGGLTGHTIQGVRSNSAAAIGSGPVSLDNGQIFIISSLNITNSISVSTRGGVLHMEGTGGGATGGFVGSISSPSSTFVAVNSNSGNNNIIKLGDVTGLSGTLALDTTNIGGVAFTQSSNGNANLNVLWYGNGTNGGTGRLQYKGTGSGTLTFGELNNYSSGLVGSTMSGIVENAVAGTTATLTIGNNNATPASFQGIIRNGTGTVALTKTGTNTQVLTGINAYTGATAINGGTLRVSGSLAAGSAVAVNSSGTLQANGTVNGAVTVAGGGKVGGTGTLAGTVTLAAGATPTAQAAVDLVDGTIESLALTTTSATTFGGAAGDKVNLNFEVGPGTADQLQLTGNFDVGEGGATITVTSLGLAANTTYDLITFPAGTGTGFATGTGTTVGALTLANPILGFGIEGTLNVTATSVQLVTSGAGAPDFAYWSGAQGSLWTANSGGEGNFTSTATGESFLAALPASTTAVYFANDSATNLTNILGTGFTIGSLTFRSTTGAVSVGGSSQLTVESGGLTLETGNGGATLGMATLALGAGQAWSNYSSNPLVVTAAVNGGSSALSLYGNAITLGGPSFTAGALTVEANLNLAGTGLGIADLSGSGSITNTGAPATISVTENNNSSFGGTIGDAGAASAISLVKTGGASLTLGGANGYSGSTLISAGTVVLGNGTALGTAGTIAAGSGTTVANGAALDLNGQTISEGLSVAGTGVSGAGALVNGNAFAPAAVNSEMLSNGSFTIDGPGDITLQRVQTVLATVTKNGAGTLTLGTGGATGHNNLLILVVNNGTVVLNMPGLLAVDRGVTINGGSTVRLAGTAVGGGQIQDDQTVALNNGTFDLNGRSEVVGALNGATGTLVTNTAASTTSVLGFGGTATSTLTGSFSGLVSDGSGKVAVTKSGLGTQTLVGAQAYTGNTLVNGGTLSLDTACLADTADVLIATGAVLNLTHSGTDIVHALYLGGVSQPNGVYDSTNTGGKITGTGKIQVGTLSGYDLWAAANAGGQAANLDFDGDGVRNGIEYFMGETGSTFTANPSLVSGTVTWPHGADFVGTYGTGNQYVVQTSPDLVTWADVPASDPNLHDGPTSLQYTPPTGEGEIFVRLFVTP